MSRKLFLSSLAMAVALPAVVAPIQAQEVRADVSEVFTDVSKSYWAYESIMKMRDAGIIHGYPDNTFKPHNAISRVHTASLFARSLDLKPIRPGKEFKDVPKTNVYYDQIQAVYRAGIFDGNTDGTFGINDNLTRGQMAKVMVIAFDLEMHKGFIFDDVSKDHWAKDYIASLYMSGITVGSDGKFMPQDSVSRAHYAAFLDRALNPEDAPVPDKPLQPEPPKPEKPEPPVEKPDPKPEPEKPIEPKPDPKPEPETPIKPGDIPAEKDVVKPSGWKPEVLESHKQQALEAGKNRPGYGSFGIASLSLDKARSPEYLKGLPTVLKSMNSSDTVEDWIAGLNYAIKTGKAYTAPDNSYTLYIEYYMSIDPSTMKPIERVAVYFAS